jgi:hypothetical protein
MPQSVPTLDSLTYRCKVCGWLCTRKTDPNLTRQKTNKGAYGEGTPPPAAITSAQYEDATTISFVAAAGSVPAKINDSANRFTDKRFRSEQPITIETTSGTNDGDYTIGARGVSRGTLTLSSSDSLTTENAATAGTVTISARTYEPNITTGCPLCGSLDSRP